MKSLSPKNKYKSHKKPPRAPEDVKPRDYVTAYRAIGYRFTKNEMNDRIYVNGELMTDGISDLIMSILGNYGYKNFQVFQRAYGAEAEQNRFHPIRDYLNRLQWDGQDYIGKLPSYFTDEDDIFGLLLRKWLIGAVSKVMNPTPTEQNPMLVLAGAQGLGKSVFVHWLGSVLPEYFISSAIYPDNKDFIIKSVSNFVWEVKELGSTTRLSDVEALKAFLDTPYASFRVPYGKYESKKYVTASFIGTINFDGNGFLNDPTGHRRFRVCQLSRIDHTYYTDLDPNQVWAQAVTLYKAGEIYKLAAEDEAKVREVNDRYVLEDPISEVLARYLDVDKGNLEWFTTTGEILGVLKNQDVIRDELERGSQMRLSTALAKQGISKKQVQIQGSRVRGWVGVRVKEKYRKFIAHFHDIS
jgi:predicted P-loop ATPase